MRNEKSDSPEDEKKYFKAQLFNYRLTDTINYRHKLKYFRQFFHYVCLFDGKVEN